MRVSHRVPLGQRSDLATLEGLLEGWHLLNPLDPTDFTSNMQYIPKISPNSPGLIFKFKVLPRLPVYLNEIISFEKIWKIWKNVFSGGYGRIGEIQHGRLWPDWGL